MGKRKSYMTEKDTVYMHIDQDLKNAVRDPETRNGLVEKEINGLKAVWEKAGVLPFDIERNIAEVRIVAEKCDSDTFERENAQDRVALGLQKTSEVPGISLPVKISNGNGSQMEHSVKPSINEVIYLNGRPK